MTDELASRAIALWDQKADAWRAWTGEQGDTNRRLVSDPVLFELLGDVHGQTVIDAGCGAGYLAVLLAERGARVVAVDASARMVEQTRARIGDLAIDARVDDASRLATIADASADVLVSNYVLMDLPDLAGAARSFARVVRPGGRAILVFSHPCFSVPGGPALADDGVGMTVHWPHRYDHEGVREERWGPFETPFLDFHRPLSTYFRTFREAGFTVDALEEPRLSPAAAAAADERTRAVYSRWPVSMVFRLVREG